MPFEPQTETNAYHDPSEFQKLNPKSTKDNVRQGGASRDCWAAASAEDCDRISSKASGVYSTVHMFTWLRVSAYLEDQGNLVS